MQSVDPRVALLVEQDRRLLMVGQGTMGMMLAAAEKAGLIPTSTVQTHFGVQRTPGGHTHKCHSQATAEVLAEANDEDDDGFTYSVVTRTHTTFTDITTDWAPVSAPEESHE